MCFSQDGVQNDRRISPCDYNSLTINLNVAMLVYIPRFFGVRNTISLQAMPLAHYYT
jgi:hypothetical protein